MIGEKGARDYTKLRRDMQEADIAHLEAASDDLRRAGAAAELGGRSNAIDACGALAAPPAAIHQEILAAVEARHFSRRAGEGLSGKG